jgi:hypothetical protein
VSVPLPWGEIDTVFLDAGNTLVSMDFELICEVLASHGVACTPDVLARAEAGARPALSRFLSGASTEWSDTFAFYVGAILEALGGDGAEARQALAPRLASDVRRAAATQRLWSRSATSAPPGSRSWSSATRTARWSRA